MFKLLIHFHKIKGHPRALGRIWQAWREHFKLPIFLYRDINSGRRYDPALIKTVTKFERKEKERYFIFRVSPKRDAGRMIVWFSNPRNAAGDDRDLNYISGELPNAWYERVGAAAAEATIVGFISAVAGIGKLEDASFEHDDVAYNAPGYNLDRVICFNFPCRPGHMFFACNELIQAYGGLDHWQEAGFQVHAKWTSGALVGLPLDYRPNTAAAAWRLCDAFGKLGGNRPGKFNPKLIEDGFPELSQLSDFLATYERQLGRVLGTNYVDRIRANDVSTPFGPQDATDPYPNPPAKESASQRTEADSDVVPKVKRPRKSPRQRAALPRQSELDEIFEQFAQAFLGKFTDATPIAFATQLKREGLDFSHESLHLVDRYLAHLHKHKKKISDADWNSTVLYAGAYTGEVIRRATGGYFRWVDYDEYIPKHPELQSLIPERNTATCALLVGAEDTMMMPLNKIARYIDEGAEHSVHYFAQVSIQQAKPQSKNSKPRKKRTKR